MSTADIIATKSSLEHSVDSWEAIAHLFTALVAVGLIIEYREPFINFIHTHDWRFISESIGGVLVTVGVAGELLTGFRATSKDGKLREANSVLALRAAELLAASNERIAELNATAEQERHARLKIERHLAGRKITDEQGLLMGEKLSKFAGQRVYISEAIRKIEVRTFAGHLWGVLRYYKWDVGPFLVPQHWLLMPGVQIFATPNQDSQAAANALFEALSTCEIACRQFPEELTPDFEKYWPAGLYDREQEMVLIVVNDTPLPGK